MRMLRNNSKISTIALVLVLTFAATLICLPAVNAAIYYSHTYIYCVASPRLVGVGQPVLVVYWTSVMPAPETDEEIAAGLRGAWYGVTITVTKPDETTQTIQMPRSDPVGGGWYSYTPDQLGTYCFQAHLPEQWRNMTVGGFGRPGGDYNYEAVDSNIASADVQEEPIGAWQESPVTTDYWTRPINTASREWSVLASNWLKGAANRWPLGASGGTTNSYSSGQGPESAHILWTMPYWAGGLMDAMFGSTGFQTAHYQGISFSPIIVLGRIYYPYREIAHGTRGYVCADLYTGETLYYKNETMPSKAQIYDYESPNQHGGFPYLWRTSGVTLPEGYTTARGLQTWQMLDAFTGNPVTIIANVSAPAFVWFMAAPGATEVYGKDGSILYYNVDNYGTDEAPQYYLTVWNSSAMLTMTNMGTSEIERYLIDKVPVTNFWQWRPASQPVHDGYYRYGGAWSLNVSTPSLLGPSNARQNQTASIRAVREREYVIVGTAGINDDEGIAPTWLMALSLEPGREGTKLWETTFTPPYAEEWGVGFFEPGMTFAGVYPEDEVVLFGNRVTQKMYGYHMKTGEKLWEGEPEEPMNYYGMSTNVYQGKLLTYGYGGQLRAYNITTGEILWNYDARTVGFESPYGGNYPIGIACIADGKIYTVSSEHSPTQPLYRGPNLRCIDAETGDEIWSTLFWGASMSPTSPMVTIADGIILGLNFFDMQIYAFGRGPSATTVTASPSITANGSSIMITGTVTDQSPYGRRNTNGILDFTLKGTPAIADEYMSAWMEHMFMQQAFPADATGVEVTLDAIDPNGNFISIGRVTSDNTGTFAYMFTPELEGRYQIIATFEGSAAYGPSFATTYLGVGAAPEEPTEPATEAEIQADIDRAIDSLTPLFLVVIAAVVVAIVLVVYDILSVRKLRK